MTTVSIHHTLKTLAQDLSKDVPRSPRETLAGYVVAARVLDKCRAYLNGTSGEYNFNSYMDKLFFEFTGIEAEAFQGIVATGASDEEMAQWIQQHAQPKDRLAIVKWNNQLRYSTPKDMPDRFQLFKEEYVAAHLPQGRPVYHIFDLFDIEEGRL